MAEISSLSNPQVKYLRALRSRHERERTGTYYIEGARIVAQAIEAGAAIDLGVISPELIAGEHAHKVVEALRAKGAPIVELSPAAFGAISFKENLQGLGAVVRPRIESIADVRLGGSPGWVALDAVGNPGNLGAVLRTCDAVGCSGIVLLGTTTDPYHPAAVRASMGAIFSQRLVRATFQEFVRWKRERGYPVVGTSGAATEEFRRVVYPTPLILLMGSERLGLTAEQQAICDLVVRIPMVGTSDSLNMAVATSIVLYEVFHQYRERGENP
jgi:TrmH family RNA methyltransferase